ncbi:hypothetical protein Tco_0210729 [Tanacetum coccineum]
MYHSMCFNTSHLVYMVLVLSLRTIFPIVPLIPTFIACSLLTCPSAPLVVSHIGICRTPTVAGQMANSVALVAFRSAWTIMVIVAFRTQRLRSAVMFPFPVPCCVALPVLCLLFGSVSSLIPSSSRISVIPGHVANLSAILALYSTWPIMLKLPLWLSSHFLLLLAFPATLSSCRLVCDFIFSGDGDTDGGGDDEGSAAANSVMHALVDDDRGVWY